jgi:hypothetical protein
MTCFQCRAVRLLEGDNVNVDANHSSIRLVVGIFSAYALFASGCGDNTVKPDVNTQYCDGSHEVIPPDPAKAWMFERDGWVYAHIEGEPCERGFQHGYLLSEQFKEHFATTEFFTYETMGLTFEYLVEQSVKMFNPKIPRELMEEMQGIADGLTAAGVPTTLDQIVAWNGYTELTESWWPTVESNLASTAGGRKGQPGHCSAFIATGSATADGDIVVGHETFDDFWSADGENIILTIVPADGASIMMQTTAGYIDSMTDFFIMSSGLFGTETTIAGFLPYDPDGVPEFVRIRNAMQYGTDLDNFTELLNDGNNGGVANIWLYGDRNTGEIAKFEQGLAYTNYQKTFDGHWTSNNVAEDPRILNLECAHVGQNDTRVQTGGRSTRWPALIEPYITHIDLEVGQTMLADHVDVYHDRDLAAANTICAHYDWDDRSDGAEEDAVWFNPYQPAGSVDGKVTTSAMVENLEFSARFGRACGIPFDVDEFLEKRPQWEWERGHLKSRPHQEYSTFSMTDRE